MIHVSNVSVEEEGVDKTNNGITITENPVEGNLLNFICFPCPEN